jgi:valyl-tRNA synthetase
MRKFWNAARFAGMHIQGFKMDDVDLTELELRPSDRWILSRLNRVVKQATQYLEDFQFNQAITAIQTFIWHEFCDMYIEEVKHRLYGEDSTADAAKYALYQIILTAAKLLAPFMPHFAEEIYQTYFAADFPQPSIHVSGWPAADKLFIDEVAEKIGNISNEVISAIRQFKAEHKMALSAELPAVEIYTTDSKAAKHLTQASEDITGTMRIGRLDISVGRPKLAERVVAIEADMAKLGPRLRSDAQLVAQALREADAEELAKKLTKGSIAIMAGGKEFKLTSDELRVVKETESAGHKVEAVDILEPPLTILITTP